HKQTRRPGVWSNAMMITKLETRPRHPVKIRQSVRQQQHQSVWEAAATLERRRLARDLHDTVIQTLFAANVLTETLYKIGTQSPDELHSSLDELRQLTQRALAETRELLLEMRPVISTDKPMGCILQDMAAAFTDRTHIPVAVVIERDALLVSDLQLALYQIVR